MSYPVSVRLDEEAHQALVHLESTGMTRLHAIRTALIGAVDRLESPQALADEVAALEADEADRAEMRAVAVLMGQLRQP
jgi:hypothetical protein